MNGFICRPVKLLLTLSIVGIGFAAPEDFLKPHNVVRCMHGAKPLKWNSEIAKLAQKWADRGVYEHSDSYSYPIKCGENIALGHQSEDSVTVAFFNEVKDYPGGVKKTGHFTAMVWKDVTDLGCGINPDVNKQAFYVCNYHSATGSPPNSNGQGGAYPESAVQSKCSKTLAECEKEIGYKMQQKVVDESCPGGATPQPAPPGGGGGGSGPNQGDGDEDGEGGSAFVVWPIVTANVVFLCISGIVIGIRSRGSVQEKISAPRKSVKTPAGDAAVQELDEKKKRESEPRRKVGGTRQINCV